MTNDTTKPWQELTVPATESASRLDHFLKRLYPKVPFSLWAKLARKGAIRVDGKKTALSQKLDVDQKIRLPASIEKEAVHTQKPIILPLSAQEKTAFAQTIVFENENMVIFNKPSGLSTQGGTQQKTSLDHLARAYFSQTQSTTPYIVHRLDKETSGLIILAKNLLWAKKLAAAFQEQLIEKTYHALVQGTPENPEGLVDAPLLIQADKTQKVVVSPAGKPAASGYQVLKAGAQVSLVELKPTTGRMHQLRVHMAHISHPILGDDKYGPARLFYQRHTTVPKRLYLHASQLTLPQSLVGQGQTCFQIPLPKVFDTVFEVTNTE